MKEKSSWYNKTPVPQSLKDRLRSIVRGVPAGTVEICGSAVTLLSVASAVFREAFEANREELYRGEYTAPPGENDYEGAANYLTEDGLAGFSLSGGGWLTSLYSNLPCRGFAAAVRGYILPGINKIVCIVSGEEDDSGLVRFYKENYGYLDYARTKDDTANMRLLYGDAYVDSFIAAHGIPYHVFLVAPGAHPRPGSVRVFDDYFDAEDFVDATIPRAV